VKKLVPLAAALALALPAAAGGAQLHPCSSATCHATIQVAGITRWASPQRLSGELDKLSLRAGVHELSYEPAGSCVAYFYGRGVVARLSVCGRGKVRIRLRAAKIDSRPVKLRIAYRVAH
jgi:hypothetical protein